MLKFGISAPNKNKRVGKIFMFQKVVLTSTVNIGLKNVTFFFYKVILLQ